MKTLNLAILMAFGLSVPCAAMSSNDSNIHIHAMQMDEISQDSVMNRIQITGSASENAPGKKYSGQQLSSNKYGAGSGKKTAKGAKKQFKKMEKKQLKKGQGEGEMDRDRDRTQDQDQLMIRDQDQDRVRNQD